MNIERNILKNLDLSIISIYIALIIVGWFSIYAAGYHDAISDNKFLGVSTRAFKQLIWIFIAISTLTIMSNINTKLYQSLSYIIYLFIMIVMLGTSLVGKAYGGHSSWYKIGMIYMQPTEFAKIATTLAISKYLSQNNLKLNKIKDCLKVIPIILVPTIIILIQGDAGSALVFTAFIVTLYREGLPMKWIFKGLIVITTFILTLIVSKIYLIVFIIALALIEIGTKQKNITKFIKVISNVTFLILLITSIDIFMNKILKPHQRNRIKTLVNPNIDPKGIGWNVTQSKIAIGSGGFTGKGFLKGTQTNFGFVPAQITDFIFCTISEEHGWIGSSLLITLFTVFLFMILNLAERQKSKFARIYGYSVFSIISFHFLINIGMTIGIMPVIGIPLPFISYGGSSLYAFSILLFILLKIDAERLSYLSSRQKENLLT